MSTGVLKRFYNSEVWKTFRANLILERITHDGVICEECGRIIAVSKHIHLHHVIELNEGNYKDTNISLNPANINIICHECHNKIHGRWQGGYRKNKERGVYIVYGPPMAGKISYVLEHMSKDDLVIDMDRLYQAVALLPLYNKPNALRLNVWGIRDKLIDNVKTRYGEFNNAWIVGGYADKYQREKLATDIGAELIYIKADKEDCLYRLQYCNDYRQKNKDEWKKYIEDWFEKYVE